MTTETTMRSAVPPIDIAVIPVRPPMISGKTAMRPRKRAPTSVRRVRMREMCSEVDLPGRTPGINAPFFWREVEIWSGSKVTAV